MVFLTITLQEQESEGVNSSDKTALPQWDAKEERKRQQVQLRRAARNTEPSKDNM